MPDILSEYQKTYEEADIGSALDIIIFYVPKAGTLEDVKAFIDEASAAGDTVFSVRIVKTGSTVNLSNITIVQGSLSGSITVASEVLVEGDRIILKADTVPADNIKAPIGLEVQIDDGSTAIVNEIISDQLIAGTDITLDVNMSTKAVTINSTGGGGGGGGPTPTELLNDTFDTSIDLANWVSAPAGYSIDTARLKYQASTSPATPIKSLDAFNSWDTSFQWKMVHPDPTNTGLEVASQGLVSQTDIFTSYVSIDIYKNNLRFANNSGASIIRAYNGTQDVYFKIIFHFGSIILQTSPDAVTWTTEKVAACGVPLAGDFHFYMSPYIAGSSQIVYYDNVIVKALNTV